MIKVTVLYPAGDGKHFDHAYYRDSHLPLVQARMGAACLGYEIDEGIAGGESAAPFVALCHIFSATLESFQAAFGPHAEEIQGDVANYTNITPVMQFSKVVVR